MPIMQPSVNSELTETLAKLATLGEMRIDMQRLRIHGHQAEHGVVRLGHGAAEFVVEFLAFMKLVEIKPGHRRPL